MTKKELIEALAQFDDDARVVVGSSEDGYKDIKKIQSITIQLDVNEGDYGPHEEVWPTDGLTSDNEIVNALHIEA